jgi:hypothetical protein
MSVFVWVMIGVALWHLSVLVPDRFYGGIIGAFIAAVAAPSCRATSFHPRAYRHTTRRASRRPCGRSLERSWPWLGLTCTALAASTATGYDTDRNSRGAPLTNRWVMLCCRNACHTPCEGLGPS